MHEARCKRCDRALPAPTPAAAQPQAGRPSQIGLVARAAASGEVSARRALSQRDERTAAEDASADRALVARHAVVVVLIRERPAARRAAGRSARDAGALERYGLAWGLPIRRRRSVATHERCPGGAVGRGTRARRITRARGPRLSKAPWPSEHPGEALEQSYCAGTHGSGTGRRIVRRAAGRNGDRPSGSGDDEGTSGPTEDGGAPGRYEGRAPCSGEPSGVGRAGIRRAAAGAVADLAASNRRRAAAPDGDAVPHEHHGAKERMARHGVRRSVDVHAALGMSRCARPGRITSRKASSCAERSKRGVKYP